MKRLILIVLLAALGAAWCVTLPAEPQTVAGGDGPRHLRGAIHVHTERSDGRGTVEEVAAAAAAAGLDFVILTDHGDGTTTPQRPAYYGDVLVIDAVEISTDGGHIVALGLSESPYPLAGEPRDVIEDVARAGAFAIAAHPGSPKEELRFTGWESPVGGLEWLNGDSEWRDESWLALGRALAAYPVRGPAALAMLLDRPDAVLQRWDELTTRRPVVAVAAVDAHARLGPAAMSEPYENRVSVGIPSYEAMFRTVTIVLPDLALERDAESDAEAIIGAIRAGHVYSAVDGLARGGQLSFTAADGDAIAMMGDRAPVGAVLRVEIEAPRGARIELRRGGRVVGSADTRSLEYRADQAGPYRVEVMLPEQRDGAVPWLLSNPIYVGMDLTAASSPVRAPASETAVVYEDGEAAGWTVEASPNARGALAVVPATGGGTQVSFLYALGGTASESPYAALAAPAGSSIAEYDRLTFVARARQPMRLSVQLRSGGEGSERWQRSVYVDETPRAITVYFDDMRPAGATRTPAPVLAEVTSLLWVVDTVNTPLGGSGELILDAIRYGR